MIGHLCFWCEEPVLPGEKRADTNMPAHYECGLRAVAGGYNHLRRTCTCYGGTDEPDPPELDKRDAAKLACGYFLLKQERREDGQPNYDAD